MEIFLKMTDFFFDKKCGAVLSNLPPNQQKFPQNFFPPILISFWNALSM